MLLWQNDVPDDNGKAAIIVPVPVGHIKATGSLDKGSSSLSITYRDEAPAVYKT